MFRGVVSSNEGRYHMPDQSERRRDEVRDPDAERPHERVRARRGGRSGSAREPDHSDSKLTEIRLQVRSRFPDLDDYDRVEHAYEQSYVDATDGYPIHVSACGGLESPLDREDLEDLIDEYERERRRSPRPGVGLGPPGRNPLRPELPVPGPIGGGQRVPDEVVAWHWTLEDDDGEEVASADRRASLGPEACRATLVAPEPGRYRVQLRLELEDGEQTASRTVEIEDYLIVSVGDSYASGQGNPDRPGRPERSGSLIDCSMEREPAWAEPAAHRSFESGPAIATRRAERHSEGKVATFLSFAATGATVEEGILGPQHPDWQDVGQLEEARRAVGDRTVDALVLSVGGNDARFADGLKALTADLIKDRTATVRASRETIQGLEDQYSEIAEKIAELDPEHVFITEYPVAMFDRTDDGTVGEGCGVFDWAGIQKVSEFEAEAIKLLGTLLNDAVADAADEHGWTYVDGVVEGFRGHGYCRDASYYVSATESCNRQGDHLGTMHPNAAGQRVYADRIADALRQHVIRPPPRVRDHRTRDGRDGTTSRTRDRTRRRSRRDSDRDGADGHRSRGRDRTGTGGDRREETRRRR